MRGKQCPECKRTWDKAYRAANSDKLNASGRAKHHARKNTPEFKDKKRAYYEANKAHIIERGMKWEAEHRDVKLRRAKEYKARHRERVLAAKKVYYQANRDKWKAYSAKAFAEGNRREIILAWHRNNPDKARAIKHRRRAREANALGSFTASEFNAIREKQRGKCATCKQKRKLVADHIMPLSKGGSNFAFNIQGLCGKCNNEKHAKILDYAIPSLFDREAC